MALTATGHPIYGIASYLGISEPVLRKYYKSELTKGSAIVGAVIKGKLVQAAMDGKPWAVCFYLKTREGFRETVRVEEANTIDADLADATDEDIAERRARLAAVEEAATRRPYLVGGTAAKKGAA